MDENLLSNQTRLRTLRDLQILDTLPEQEFDDLVHLASSICGTPISLVSLVEQERQWFKAKVGLGASQTPIEQSFCAHAMAQTDPSQVFEVEDARIDERFAANPLVTGDLNIQFYAGMPLVMSDGHAMGSLCVIDHRPRRLTSEQVRAMRTLGRSVVSLLELRKQNRLLQEKAVTLLEADNRLRAILNNSSSMIYLKDRSGRLTFVNEQYCLTTGRRSEELLGMTAREISPNLMANQIIAHDEQIWQTGRAGVFEEEATIGSVPQVFVSTRFPLTNAAGEMTALCGISTDITTARQREVDLRVARDAAEGARRQAEAASLTKSEFLANMSHELRTPLNGVVGMLELLGGTSLDPTQVHYSSVAKASAATLLTLINDILDLSKIEAGKLELDPVDFELRDLCGQAVEILSAKAKTKGLQLVCRINPRVTGQWFKGPADRVRQILINLLNNALKFTEAGSVTLAVDPTETPDLLKFSVSDTGIGIPADRLDRLFKTFSQVDASTTRKYGGTGLGLSISKHLATLMGGQIGVESEPGNGSTFWFTAKLPAVAGHAVANLHNALPCTESGRGRRILVAEDNDVNQMVISGLLKRLGYAFELVADGQAALAAATTGDFDMILMDCQMPVLDGLEATRSIRAAEAGSDRHLPIIALTASAMTGDRDRCVAAGMDDFLCKPLDPKQLAMVLERWSTCSEAVAA